MSFQSVIPRTQHMSPQRVILKTPTMSFQRVILKTPVMQFQRFISRSSTMSFQRVIARTPAMSLKCVIARTPAKSFQRFISRTRAPANPFRRFVEGDHLKQFPTISRMQTVFSKTKWQWRLPFGAAILGIATYLHGHYFSSLKNNPLIGRTQFLPLTDEEVFDFTNAMADTLLYSDNVVVETRRDATGKALDARTQRLDRIVNTLIEKNPELTTMLSPLVRWQPIVIENCFQLKADGSSYSAGHILIAGDVMDLFPNNDDELSQLVAHEMSHVVLQHSNEEFGRNLFLFQFMLHVLQKIKTIKTDLDIGHYVTMLSKHLSKPDKFLQETEADKIGFMFAAKACYDYRKFGDHLPKLEKYIKSIKDEAKARDSDSDSSDAELVDDKLEDDIFNELSKSDIYYKVVHPDTATRVALLQSKEYLDNAAKWRRESECIPPVLDPVEAVRTLSQKVDEINASRKAIPIKRP